MKKICIIVEGETEALFTKHILLLLYRTDQIKIRVNRLISYKSSNFIPDHISPDPKIFVQISLADGDNGVISHILKKGDDLIDNNFDKIICLRDVFSDEYKKKLAQQSLPFGVVDERVCRDFISGKESVIRKLKNHSKIFLHFSIMEIEAWFLMLYEKYYLLDSSLDLNKLSEELDLDLVQCNIESVFKPSKYIEKLFKFLNSNYGKKRGRVLRLLKIIISYSDLELARNKAPQLNAYLKSLELIDPDLNNL